MSVDFEIPYRKVKFGGGTFDVRGIDSEDFVWLTTTCLDDLKLVVAQHSERYPTGEIPEDQVSDLLISVAKSFPAMCAEIISRCADSPDDYEKFRRIPFPVQLMALKDIMELTITDGGYDLKNAVGVLANLMEGANLTPGPLTDALRTIIGMSENQLPS